jgi:hypothetical protein
MPFPDPTATAYEQGLPLPEAKREDNSLPPGGGKWVVPHFTSFAAIINSITRTYRWTFDEALRDSQTNALALRRDPVIMDALRSRQLPVCQLQWHLEARDETDERQVQAIKDGTEIIKAIPNWQRYLMHLSEAVFYGRYGVQEVFDWDFEIRKGKRSMVVRDYQPVLGDKLVFKYSGQVGILVHTTELNRLDKDTDITDRGRAHFLNPEEREQIVIHQYEPEDADFFEGEMAGAIKGVGIRSRLYWFWWLRNQVLSWLMDYLERVGAGGIIVWFYESGNNQSYTEVSNAVEQQSRNNAILFPRYRDNTTGGPGFEHIEPSMAGAQLLESLVTQYFDAVIRRYILGQTLSQDTASTGLGSGVAELHADTFARLIKYDAMNLAETLTRDLISVLWRYNFPGVPAPRFVFDVDKPNAAETLEAAKTFWEMGGEIDADELRSILGLSKPQPGAAVLTKLPAPSPAGVGQLPQGVPVQGTPGPVAPPGQGATDQGQAEQSYLFHARGEDRHRFALSPDQGIRDLANGYMAQRHLAPTELAYEQVHEPTSRAIADWYDKATHSPNDPAVRSAYEAFKRETLAQWKYLQAHGFKFDPWEHEGQPYRNSAEMSADVRHNRHLYFYTGGSFTPDNHMTERTGELINGYPLTYNDVFRAVHDVFGHAHYGNKFGPRGEEHAYRAHSQMYTPEALPAMGTETRGQNSWVNFGPYGHLPVTERPFAPQKNAVLPKQFAMEDPVLVESDKEVADRTHRAALRAGFPQTPPSHNGSMTEVHLNDKEGRQLSLDHGGTREGTPLTYVEFRNAYGWNTNPKYVKGSIPFLRQLQETIRYLHAQGRGISYSGDKEHKNFYRRTLPRLGFRQIASRDAYLQRDEWLPVSGKVRRFAANEEEEGYRNLTLAMDQAFGQLPIRNPRSQDQQLEHNDRLVQAHYRPSDNTVYVQFKNQPTSAHPGLGDYEVNTDVREGSVDFLRRLRTMVKTLAGHGYGIEYHADPKHREFYTNMFPRLGYKLAESVEEPTGMQRELWRPISSPSVKLAAQESDEVDRELLAEIRKKMPDKRPDRLPAMVGKIGGIEVRLVDGNRTKLSHGMDFAEGANDLEIIERSGLDQHGIPDRTVLIDALVDPWEYVPNAYHELYERRCMAEEGETYDEAHETANRHEQIIRAEIMPDRRRYAAGEDVPPLMHVDELLKTHFGPSAQVETTSWNSHARVPGVNGSRNIEFMESAHFPNSLYVAFEKGGDYNSYKAYQRGGIDFLRPFGNMIRDLGRRGFSISYTANPEHKAFYNKIMPKLGFRLGYSGPGSAAGFDRENWEPVKEFQAAAPAAIEYHEVLHLWPGR